MDFGDGKLPSGHADEFGILVRSSVELGQLIRAQRNRLELRQLDVAGLGNRGNRFVIDVESGKPTVQLQKVLDMLDLLGLEVLVRRKS